MSDKPLFDPMNAHKSLTDAFEKKQASGRNLSNVFQDTQQEITGINRSYAQDLNRFGQQTDRVNDAAMEALDRLDALDSNPEIVNRVMSLFDSNYSRTVQERKLQRAQWETQRLSQQMSTKEDLRQLKIQEAGQELQLAEHLYQFDQQGFLDQANLLEIGFQVEAAIDKRTLQLAQNASMENLAAWRKDPSKAPGALRGKPGLIDTVYFERKTAEMGLVDQQQLQEIRDFQIAGLRSDRLLAEMDDNMLRDALKTRNLPQGLSYGTAADEWERRQTVDYSLRTAAQAVEEGDRNLEADAKGRALASMKTDQIALMMQNANQSPDGSVSIPTKFGTLSFTQQELEDAHEAAYNRDVARQQARNDVIIGLAGQAGAMDKADNSINSLAALANPGGVWTDDPLDSLAPSARAEIKGLIQQITVASNLPNGGAQATKKIAELQARLDEYAENIIKGKPDDVQPAYREYYRDGAINDANAAADFMVQAVPNPATLAHDLTMGPIWEQLSEQYNAIAGQDIKELSFNQGSEGLVIAETDKPNNVDVLEKAARQTRDYATGVLFQSYAAETIVRMQQRYNKQMNHQRDGLNIWDGIVNQNTLRFDEQVYNEDGSFDNGRFAQYLAAKTFVLRAKSILQPGESLNQILENSLRRNASAFTAETMSGSIEKAGVHNVIFGNNASYYLGQAVNDFGVQTNTSLQVASERAMQVDQQIKGLTAYANDPFASEVGPQLNRSNRQQGITPHEPGDDLMIEFLRQGKGQ